MLKNEWEHVGRHRGVDIIMVIGWKPTNRYTFNNSKKLKGESIIKPFSILIDPPFDRMFIGEDVDVEYAKGLLDEFRWRHFGSTH